MPTGKVKWFNSKKGYGFITEDGTEKDIFLHVSALEDSRLKILTFCKFASLVAGVGFEPTTFRL